MLIHPAIAHIMFGEHARGDCTNMAHKLIFGEHARGDCTNMAHKFIFGEHACGDCTNMHVMGL